MDIAKFCGHHDPRSYLRKPMRHDGHLYATNGHIAVRIADDPDIEADPMPHNMQNGVLQKMATDTTERTWFPVPKIDKATIPRCQLCDGTGRAKLCPSCDGTGEFEHYGIDYECKCCNGSGYDESLLECNTTVCPDCGGCGLEWREPIKIDGVLIAARYLHLIGTEIPGAEIGVSNDPNGMQLFRAPGVIGVVIPMRP